MPELPEVETMRVSLLPYCNKIIEHVEVRTPKLRKPINTTFIDDIKLTYIVNIERLGKYLLFNLSNKKFLLMHAGMSGKFIITNKKYFKSNKHNHIIFLLQDNLVISYHDPRKFGLAQTFNSKENALINLNLGADALSKLINAEYLKKKAQNTNCDIKTFLLNQKILSGIGNIYASEILFYCKINPLTNVKSLNLEHFKLLALYIKKVLKKSIKLGGSTLKDYQKPNGEIGYFQNTFLVYNKENKPCKNCGTLIKKIKQKGRSTYFCPKEQIFIKLKT